MNRTRLQLAAGLALLAPLLHLAAMAFVGLRDDVQGTYDFAVVLGNRVEVDGTPSPRLKARLDRALELHRTGVVDRVIVSGGVGETGWDEAAVMGGYLAAAGIPEEDIVLDSLGVNTRATAVATAQIAGPDGSVVVVTQWFHVWRTRVAVKQAGVRTIGSASADFFEWRDVYSTAREVPAFYSYLLRR